MRARRLLFIPLFAGFLTAEARAAGPAANLARQVQAIELDPADCYRVSELNFSKADVRVYLTSGYLAFAKPINGVRIAAVFVADVEGGDAEILVIPPNRAERMSLASFTESPNLDEHFKGSAMIFTDNTAADLEEALNARQVRKDAEWGKLLADSWTPLIHNLTESFQVRVVAGLLSGDRRQGLFYMAVKSAKLGNFDVVYDPEATEQIIVGQLAYRDNSSFFDVWTSFPAKNARKDHGAIRAPAFELDDYRIDAAVHPDLSMTTTTSAKITLKPGGAGGVSVLPFWIAPQMRVVEAKLDGAPVEVFQRESLRQTLIRASGNEEFLVVLPTPLDASKTHEIEFRHEGSVISKAGEQVFFVSARGNWYPRAGAGYARYELTFHYPANLMLVATGDPIGERTDGDTRVSQFRVSSPIRFAGFNLGDYNCTSREAGAGKINICANREMDAVLKKATARPPTLITDPETARRANLPMVKMTQPANPSARLGAIAEDVAGAFEFMSSLFGPPPLSRLTVAPIPGSFGQGFPGLIYLSTLAYLADEQRPEALRTSFHQTFFSDILDAHEVAHQWWGNLLTTAAYEDDWIMEALSDYSALMFLEKKNGSRVIETVLDTYKNDLLKKTDSGRTIESMGPITWGIRLLSSHSPESWRTITYEKGAWIIHMLRRRLGDEQFVSLLHVLCDKYRFRTITIEELREEAARLMPAKAPDTDLKLFFDNWIYGTGIPTIKLTHTIRGNQIRGTLTALDAGDDFSGYIPVEVTQSKRKTTYWLQASSDGSPFSITLRQPATTSRIAVAAADSLIVRR